VRLWLSLIAYNLGNLWRRLAQPARIGNLSLTSLQQRLVKTGGRLIKHARYYFLLLAESHLTRRLFWRHAAKDYGATIASFIGNPQSSADFGDEIGRQRDKCLMTRLETCWFRMFYANAKQDWSVAA
jgi:hypothetical protein